MELRVHGTGSARYGRFLLLVSLISMAVGVALPAERAAAATADRTILFVVDTSTSMYGEPLAETKRALHAASSGIPAGAQVGLRSFGGPCEDGGITRLPLSAFNPPAFASAVESLSIEAPGTPTPAALRAAAAMLPRSGDRTIVLVSDGGSSCGPPCPVARQLADELGEGFRFDVVGFRAPGNAESELNCIAQVTGGSYVSVSDSVGLQKALTESAAARVMSLRLRPKTFAAAAKGGSISGLARRRLGRRVGTQVLYTISENVKVRFTVERLTQGRRAKGKCRMPTPKTKRARRCTRYVKMPGSFVHNGKAGENRFHFTGRPGARKLRPGRYRLVATAINPSGNTAKPKRSTFRIVRRALRR